MSACDRDFEYGAHVCIYGVVKIGAYIHNIMITKIQVLCTTNY